METPNFINIPKENCKTQVTQNHIKRKQTSTPQISTNRQRFQIRELSMISQLNVYKSQRNIEPLNFTFHATDRSKRSLFLGTIVRKGIVTSIYRDTSLKVSVLIPKSAR